MNSISLVALLAVILFPLVLASLLARSRGLSFRSQLGAVTLNYVWPATGAVAPAAGTVHNKLVVDVTATADADTTATIPHLMGVTPLTVNLAQLISQALTALSAWAVTTIDGTNVVLTKLTSTGSGSANAQVRVTIERPHTLTK